MTPTGASETRAVRLVTALVAATTLASTVGTSFVAGMPDAQGAPAAYRVALVGAIVVPLVAGALAPWAGLRVLRALNAATVAGFAALMIVFAVAVALASPHPAAVPWFITVTAAPVMASLAAGGRTAAWVTLAATTLGLQAVRMIAGSDALDAAANDLLSCLASAAIVVFAGGLVQASRQFDAVTASARDAAARRSADEARRSAHEHLQALVHDELLSTLSLAARAPTSLRAALARQAARGRRMLQQTGEGETTTGTATERLTESLASLVRSEAPDARFVIESAEASPVPLDSSTLEALTGAARQALANSSEHAGAGATCTVTVRHDGNGVRVRVHDDGVGFDPDAVPGTRMGIRTSVLGRVQAVAGATASIVSAPGAGTTIELAWTPPPRPSAQEAPPPMASLGLGGAEALTTGRYAVALTLVLAALTGLAGLAVIRTGEAPPALVPLAGITVGFVALGLPRDPTPSPGRTAFVLIATSATAALAWIPTNRDVTRFGDVWFVAALAFVLLVLALRGRACAALLGAAVAAGIALSSALVQQSDPTDIVAATTRLLAIVGIGVGFRLGTDRVHRRTLALRSRELELVREETFRAETARELRARSREVETLIGDVLARLEGDGELDEGLRRACVVLEGRLRDGYRAGRLASEELIEAAAAARARGVDVALFDDPEERELPGDVLDEVVSWLAARLDETREGRFTGRVLPADRRAWVSAATDVSVVELHPSPR